MMRLYGLDVNWSMLKEQKAYLLALIDADCQFTNGLTKCGPYSADDHPLDGLVQLIDEIQDQGEAAGERVYSEEDDE